MSKALDTLLNTLAEKMGMGDDGAGLLAALKTTAFKPTKVSGQMVTPTDAQIMALLVISNQYGLNPWLKEIYAYPDKFGGIVPVVGVDGWARIINTNPQYDGVDFEQDADMCTCTIYRKDRGHPTRITEYMVECRGTMGPWLTHPYRMLRHKSLIQCARMAFGFGGIYEQDEAERIIEAVDMATGEVIQVAKPRRASESTHAALAEPEAPVVLQPVIKTAAPEQAPVEQVPRNEPTPQAASAPQAAHDTGEPASPGEMMNVIKTCAAKRIDLAGLLGELGMDLDPATLAGLTKNGFKALKARL